MIPIPKKIIALGVLLSIFIVGGLGFRVTSFRVVSVEPDTKNFSAISPFMDVVFSKPLDDKSLIVSSVTSSVASTAVIDKTRLRIYLNNLRADERYVISISSIQSTSGKKMKDLVYDFVAKDIPFDKLSSSQRQAILKYQDTPYPTRNDPILNFLPHGDLNYELSANVQGTKLIIQARLLLSAADVRINEAAAVAKYKEQVVGYIKSKNLDPSKYTIEYEVVRPSL